MNTMRRLLRKSSYEDIRLKLPEEIETGKYRIYCRIGGGKNPVVKLATDTENDGEMFCLSDIEVVE